jgi:hypothetical protein
VEAIGDEKDTGAKQALTSLRNHKAVMAGLVPAIHAKKQRKR